MLLLALTLALARQDPQVVDGVIVHPQWIETATAEQLMPERARDQRTDYQPTGAVDLRCTVRTDGRLEDCRLIALSTRYPELGRTAIEAARHFRHAARLRDGGVVAGMPVLLKLRWRSPE
jgi:TonB family protein